MSHRLRLAILTPHPGRIDRPGRRPEARWPHPHRQGRPRRLDDRRAGRAPEDHGRRPGHALRHAFGQELPPRHPPSRRGLAQGARRLRGDGVRHRAVRAPRHRPRPERRPVPGREPRQPHPRLPRRRRRRQARGQRGLRHRPEPAVRDRLLPGRARAEVRLRRQHRLGRPLPLQERRHEGIGGDGDDRQGHPQRQRARRRRRSLDARPRVLARRQDPVRLGRLAVERRRQRSREAPRRRSWPSTPTARTSASSPTASATRWAWPRTPRPGSSGPR